MVRWQWILGAVVAVQLPPLALAGEPAVDFVTQVKPILRERCYACHGALKQEGGLRLDSAAFLRTGGDQGPAVIAGRAADSLLMHRIAAAEGERMPPEGAPLTVEQIAAIRRWIDQGALAAQDDVPEDDPRRHWSFLSPVRPSLPSAVFEPVRKRTSPLPLPTGEEKGGVFSDRSFDETDTGNPLDAFLAARRQRDGTAPLPPANRTVLLRRVTLDLIGIPPTVDEIRDFLADDSPIAYERVVDRLLQSPLHGERWARHWMDVWRYSDWYGRRAVPDVMNSYPMIWRWRDWIVRSLNADRGYDQMVAEMLAADELLPADDSSLAATGFLVRSWFKWNYETWKKDLVEHTGKAFLGLTLNCCQCHDHKYDPLSQEEYFRFRAFFEPLELRHDRVAGEPDPGPFVKYVYGKPYGPIRSGMVRVFDEQLDAETFMFAKGDARLRIPGRPPVAPAAPAVLGGDQLNLVRAELPITAAYPGMKPFVQAEEREGRRLAVHAAIAAVEQARKSARAAEEAVEAARRELASLVDGEPVPDEKRTEAARANLAAAEGKLRLSALAAAAAEARRHAARADLASLEARIEADAARYSTGRLDEDRQQVPEVRALIAAACRSDVDAAVAAARADVAAAESAVASAEAQRAEADRTADAARRKSANAALQTAQQQLAAAAAALQAARDREGQPPGDYRPLSPKYPQQSTGRRAALARWIASRQNPLTARVAVNHIWLRHFGQALVETTHDFGRNGSRPTHPDLLDWLACELMEHDWSMKHMHRLIVTSSAYRMASALPHSAGPVPAGVAAANRRDPDNRSYWRFPTLRMQAEVVRDSLLAVAEELDLTLGGPELDHRLGLTSGRRSIYFAHHGEERMEFLELFDAASALECYRRSTSVQPQQALALTNSELTRRLSRQLARKLAATASPEEGKACREGAEAFVRQAFLQVLGRAPRDAELEASVAFLKRQAARLASPDAAATQEPAATLDPAERARENLVHALMNHNDFVTIR